MTIAVAAGAWFAVGNDVQAFLDNLPRQSPEAVEFAAPSNADRVSAPFAPNRPGLETVRIATATPFPDGPPVGAIAALNDLANAHSQIAEAVNIPLTIGTDVEASGNGLVVAAASKAFTSEPAQASGTQLETPKPLATRLFDDDRPEWQSQYYLDNPLTGAIIKADGTPSDAGALLGAAKAARYVLLGEIHDNPDHHRLQAGIIDDLAESGSTPGIVFEMVPARLAGTLKAVEEAGPEQIAAIARSLEWTERGWPDFSIYAPIFETALENGLGLVAGDLDRDRIQSISRTGGTDLTDDERSKLGLDAPLGDDERAELAEELKSAHCGLLPDAAIEPMSVVQRARDGAMAAAMQQAADENGSAVLISGSGHVRTDRGVPSILSRNDPESVALAVQMVEVVSSDASEASDYGITQSTPAPFDFTIFTPRADVTDHCAALRESMGGAATSSN